MQQNCYLGKVREWMFWVGLTFYTVLNSVRSNLLRD
jgi:hypothetical protein